MCIVYTKFAVYTINNDNVHKIRYTICTLYIVYNFTLYILRKNATTYIEAGYNTLEDLYNLVTKISTK